MLTFDLSGKREAERVIVACLHGIIGVVPRSEAPCRTRIEPLHHNFVFACENKARAQSANRDLHRLADREYLRINVIIV